MENRRTFLRQGGAGVAAGAAALHWAGAGLGAVGANETVVVALIGCGGQGTSVVKRLAGLPGVEVAHVCDPDESRAGASAREVEKVGGKAPATASDLRKVLDDRSVDAVVVATPDHWHAPASILALAAGKHVYVEKPCSHNVREGRLLVEAARKAGKVVQHGTQSRSNPLIQQAVDLLRQGAIGEVKVAKAFNVQKRSEIGHARPGEPPAGFDYDLWLGPAPFVPFQANRHHYTWHWWYDFGTGDMGNDGVHELDIARWGLGVETHPSTVAALGGKLVFDDDQQFPDTQLVAFDYPGDGTPAGRKQLVFEMRIWSPCQPDGVDNGNAFYGTEGWMLLSKRGLLKVFDRRNNPVPLELASDRATAHQEDFLAAIRTGKTPTAEIEVGHLSASLCHLGNVATRLGRTLRFDPAREQVVGDDEADKLMGRTYRDGHWAVPRGA